MADDYEWYDEYNEDDDSYYYESGESESSLSKISLSEVYSTCLIPTLFTSFKSVYLVFLCCLVYRLSLVLVKKNSPHRHVVSIATGLLSLHSLFSLRIVYIVSLLILSYFFLFFTTYFQLKRFRNFLLTLLLFSYIYACELWLVDSTDWHRIRGSQMIIIMKSVSISFDLDSGKVKNIPNLILYAGYLLNPSSSIFGPWVSFNQYNNQLDGGWSFKSIRKLLVKFFFAFFFLMISTCWAEYFISFNWKWIAAYRDALSFRMSHYFISYLSEATLLLSGYSTSEFNSVTNPLKVEFPRSLVTVVVHWNIPMHTWLKTYIFSTSRKYGNFFAVLSTYAVSSLLHGASFQLSAVLLSLGLYSYVEVILRKTLAAAFNACILAKSCKKDCGHRYKDNHLWVLLCNHVMLLMTMFHLAYLGVVFGASQEEESGYNWQHSLHKWSSLNYLSHYIAFLTYAMYILIK